VPVLSDARGSESAPAVIQNPAQPEHPGRLETGAAVSSAEDEATRTIALGRILNAVKPVEGLNEALLQRTCRAHPERSYYETAPNYCRDTPGTSQLHPGQTCFREVPRRSGPFDCPPGDQVCFDSAGRCSDSWDEASPVESKDPDGTCNLHFACSIAHGWKDKVIQTWLDQTLEETGRRQVECVRMCNTQPWYLRGFCLQGCTGRGMP